jgi:hypothetical protein
MVGSRRESMLDGQREGGVTSYQLARSASHCIAFKSYILLMTLVDRFSHLRISPPVKNFIPDKINNDSGAYLFQ